MELTYREGTLAYLSTLSPAAKQGIRQALRLMRDDIRHPGLDVKQLRKNSALLYYRIRIGDYRIIFSPRGQRVFVWRIMHRSEWHAWLANFDP